MLSGAVQHSSTPARLANSAGNWSIKWITFHRFSLCTCSPRKVMGIEGNIADTYEHSKWPTMAAKVSCTVKTATCSNSSSSSCKVCNNSYGSPRIWLCNLWKPTIEREFYFEWVLCLILSCVHVWSSWSCSYTAELLHSRVFVADFMRFPQTTGGPTPCLQHMLLLLLVLWCFVAAANSSGGILYILIL